jgi:hypothetical protein
VDEISDLLAGDTELFNSTESNDVAERMLFISQTFS